MANKNIKWNMRAFRQLRTSDETQQMLQDLVDRAVEQLPEGYVASVQTGQARARGSVITGDFDSMLDNSQNNSLVRLLSELRVGD